MSRPNDRNLQFNATYRNIVSLVFASTGQTIATFRRNISQHCWAQHIARVWPPCCDVLRHVESWKSNQCGCPGATLLLEPGQMTTTSCNIHKCCVKNLTIFKFVPTTPNMLQHVATWPPNARNKLRTTMLRYVTLKCYDGLAGTLLNFFQEGRWGLAISKKRIPTQQKMLTKSCKGSHVMGSQIQQLLCTRQVPFLMLKMFLHKLLSTENKTYTARRREKNSCPRKLPSRRPPQKLNGPSLFHGRRFDRTGKWQNDLRCNWCSYPLPARFLSTLEDSRKQMKSEPEKVSA